MAIPKAAAPSHYGNEQERFTIEVIRTDTKHTVAMHFHSDSRHQTMLAEPPTVHKRMSTRNAPGARQHRPPTRPPHIGGDSLSPPTTPPTLSGGAGTLPRHRHGPHGRGTRTTRAAAAPRRPPPAPPRRPARPTQSAGSSSVADLPTVSAARTPTRRRRGRPPAMRGEGKGLVRAAVRSPCSGTERGDGQLTGAIDAAPRGGDRSGSAVSHAAGERCRRRQERPPAPAARF